MKTKQKSRKKTFIIIIVLLALISVTAIVIFGFAKAGGSNRTSQDSRQVKTVTVGTQDIEKTITGTGQIITGDEETVVLEEDKTVDEILVEEGQAVKEGDALLSYTDGTTMKATVNGVVETIPATESTSTRDKNTPGVVIMNTDNLTIELSVDETDLQSLKLGQAAQITVNALPDTPYAGKVTKISETGSYENGSSTFTVTITLDKTENVKIGMSADVKIVISSVKDAVAVPIEAVSGSGGNAKVMLVSGDGTAAPVSVELGLANEAYVQIVSGLSAGDTIQYTVQSQSPAGASGRMPAFGANGANFGSSGMPGEYRPDRSGTAAGSGAKAPAGDTAP